VSFRVSATPTAKRQADALRGKAAKAYEDALLRFEAEGCAAADYRLTGQTVDRICSAHLYGNYRALICFPDEESVVIALVGEHSRGSSDDVYGSVYELLGIDEPIGKRTKPPCCEEDGGPPVDPGLLDQMLRAAARLQRRR
jgi:hypothetical protein